MSELKYQLMLNKDMSWVPCYLKSEADNVIAYLENKLDLYKRGFKEDDKINAYLYVELRHHKYKRCLAMAALWSERIETSTDAENELVALRRYNKWTELAKKFKEPQ